MQRDGDTYPYALKYPDPDPQQHAALALRQAQASAESAPSALLSLSPLTSRQRHMLLHTFLVCFALQFSLVFGQFGFFEQMFGGHQQQEHRPAGGMGQWQAHSDAGTYS